MPRFNRKLVRPLGPDSVMEAGFAELLTFRTQATLLELDLAHDYIETLQHSIRSVLYAQAVADENGEPIPDVLDAARRVVNGRTQTERHRARGDHLGPIDDERDERQTWGAPDQGIFDSERYR